MAKKTAPAQKRLPGVEDAAIEAIEAAIEAYVDVRDKRVAMTRREVSAKDDVLKELRKAKKTHYHHGKYDAEIVPEGEKLKCRILDEDDE